MPLRWFARRTASDRRSLFRTEDFRLVVRDTFATPARIGLVGNPAIPGMGRRQYGRSILNRQCAPCRDSASDQWICTAVTSRPAG
jgi:hypothetical protein